MLFSDVYSFRPGQMQINRQAVYKHLGVPAGTADDFLNGLFELYANQCLEICSARACYVVVANPLFLPEGYRLEANGQSFELGNIVFSALKKSEKLAFFVGTAGNEIEELSKNLIDNNHALEGVLVNLIASEIAENIAALIHKQIETEQVLAGYKITNRYSPGYCSWPVTGQHSLFSVLGQHNCGVKLTETALMLPVKSVSGIVGIGTNVIFRDYACAKCQTNNCIYRNQIGK